MDVLTAYTFTVLENQVLAAVKTVPLGQMAGQKNFMALTWFSTTSGRESFEA